MNRESTLKSLKFADCRFTSHFKQSTKKDCLKHSELTCSMNKKAMFLLAGNVLGVRNNKHYSNDK